MTSQTPSGNGCSLEDCYTNLFALADLAGIKWRRLRSESTVSFARPLEDPVLSTYVKCLRADILCTWAKVQYSYGDMSKAANQLGYKRELWIFWYGDEPNSLDAIVPKELAEVESGSWDGGMSYECRTFVFKALHTRIERCLLAKKYVRLGRWFVQPHESYSDASLQLSFSFQNFSLHGDSTVCASVDVERHQPLLFVTEQHVQLARSSPGGIPVILSPYNLAGILVGQSSCGGELDGSSISLLQDWVDFYPMDRHGWNSDSQSPFDMPPLLDVVVAGFRMRYPAPHVLISKDYPIPPAGGVNGIACPSPAVSTYPGDVASDAPPSAADDALAQVRQARSGQQKAVVDISSASTRPKVPVPAVDGVVQKTFEEACILPAKRANTSGSAMPVTGSGSSSSQADDEQGQWTLCDPSAKLSCICGRQALGGSVKSSIQSVTLVGGGGRGAQPNASPAMASAAAKQTTVSLSTASTASNVSRPSKVEWENSGPTQAVPYKRLSFHRRLRKAAVPNAASAGERLTTFSLFNGHRRKIKDSASPLSAAASPACNGGLQTASLAERIMPTLSPQNPSRDTVNPAASESQPSQLALLSSNQSSGGAAAATAAAAMSQANTAELPVPPACSLGPVTKLPADSGAASAVQPFGAGGYFPQPQTDRLKRPHLPAYPALEPGRSAECEDLSTPSFYDFGPSDDWLAQPAKKIKLLPAAVPTDDPASPVTAQQKRAMPYCLASLNHQSAFSPAGSAPVGRNSAVAAGGLHQLHSETGSGSTASNVADSDQHPTASPCTTALVSAAAAVAASSPPEEPKGTRAAISPSSPITLPFGSGLKSVNSLQPKLSDLDNIFDGDDDVDPSMSPDGIQNTDASLHEHGKGSSLKSAIFNGGAIGVSELCQMFPTPPSLEGCLALSPVACHDTFSSMDSHNQPQATHFYDGSAVSTSLVTSVLSRFDEKQDSPTRLVKPPQFSSYVASPKYAPIDLPSTKVVQLATPQWHILDPKLGKSPSPPSLTSKPAADTSASVAGAIQAFPSLNHDSGFFVSASPSAASCSSHIVGFDNPSPAPSCFTRKAGAAPTPADSATQVAASQAAITQRGLVVASLPEADSLVVNLMLSDSLLNLFKDSSFDSCNICICNTNIKGTDVGLYLPDPAKEAQYRCTCGFSAAVNRWNGYCSGLFYEDEADIIGMRDTRFDDRRPPLDPVAFVTGSNSSSSAASDAASAVPAERDSGGALMDMELCAITYSTSFLASQRTSSAATRRCLPAAFSPNVDKRLNVYRADVNGILVAALDAGRAASGSGFADVVLPPSHATKSAAAAAACLADWPLPPLQVSPSLHSGSRDWPQQSRSTRSSDVMAALKSLQHVLQEACHKKRSTRLWDSSYVVSGPLTWKDFHKMAWRGSEDGCKPQPIPSILVGYDKDWVSYSPFVLKYWENLLLRPYGRTHSMAYVVIAPDCSSAAVSGGGSSITSGSGILSSIRSFFRELSTVYETCQLGRHIPLDRTQNPNDGIVQLGRKTALRLAQQQQTNSDSEGGKSAGSAASGSSSSSSWISNLGDDALSKKLKLYAQAFQCILAPLLSLQPIDKSLFESTNPARSAPPLPPPPLLAGASAPGTAAARPGGGMPAPLQPSSSSTSLAHASASFSALGPDQLEERPGESLSATALAGDPLKEADDGCGEDGSLDDVGLVIYVVEDVTFAACGKPTNLLAAGAKTTTPASATAKTGDDEPDDGDDQEQCAALTVGLYGVVRCYHELLAGLPENIRSRLQLQIVPLSMVTHIQSGTGDGANGPGSCSQLNLMKSLCFSVYSRCQQTQSHVATGRALTSYGPLVSGPASGCSSSTAASKICLSPYILAPQRDVQARFGTSFSADGTCSGVLLCTYCLSEDQRWLLASVTDENGELRSTKAINMAVTDRSRRKRSLAAHRHGLQKLLDFLLDIISRTCVPWRIVIGRLGRLGHEELKVWATLLNHKCLIRANVKMRGDDCRPCLFLPAATDTPTIVSACLTSLEPHKSFRILTDAVRRLPTHKDKHHTAAAASSMSSTMLAGNSAGAGNGSGGALGARLLNTPDDVSCTHILVIPNSTTAGGSQGHHDAPLDLPPDLTDDVGIFDLKEDEFDMLFTMNDSPGHTSMDSPGGIGRDPMGSDGTGGLGAINNSMANGLSLMRGLSTSGNGAGGSRSATATAPGAAGMGGDCSDDVAPNLLQQPLAMGYYLSTAPAGPLPPWFWATCPQEQYACPTSLKFALHFHSFLQQQHQDELVGSTSAAGQSRNASAHPLDSSSTCDVLRFVLEAYDKLSWLTVDASTNDRSSCLPVHVSHLVELSQAIAAVSNIVGSG